MGSRLAFDCETDGLLDTLTKLHCLAVTDLDTGEQLSFADQPGHRPIREGLALLAKAKLLVGHNIIEFDIPAIKKVYPDWTYVGLVRDTIVLARVMWPHIKERDFRLADKGILPKRLIGNFSPESFGYRLGILKQEYDGGWEKWSPTMHSYMLQDVVVTVALWGRCVKEAETWGVPIEDPNPPAKTDCIQLEHRVAEIVAKIQRSGERVTAEEIRCMASELDDGLGGVYTLLAADYQLPSVRLFERRMEKRLGVIKLRRYGPSGHRNGP